LHVTAHFILVWRKNVQLKFAVLCDRFTLIFILTRKILVYDGNLKMQLFYTCRSILIFKIQLITELVSSFLIVFYISRNSVLKRDDSENILKYLKHAFHMSKRDSTFLLSQFLTVTNYSLSRVS